MEVDQIGSLFRSQPGRAMRKDGVKDLWTTKSVTSPTAPVESGIDLLWEEVTGATEGPSCWITVYVSRGHGSWSQEQLGSDGWTSGLWWGPAGRQKGWRGKQRGIVALVAEPVADAVPLAVRLGRRWNRLTSSSDLCFFVWLHPGVSPMSGDCSPSLYQDLVP